MNLCFNYNSFPKSLMHVIVVIVHNYPSTYVKKKYVLSLLSEEYVKSTKGKTLYMFSGKNTRLFQQSKSKEAS